MCPYDGLFLHMYCMILNLFWRIDNIFMPKMFLTLLEISLPHYFCILVAV